ncbi:hypothetical protein N9L47_12845 [Rhodobacteraceae bacterium]|nr:hypothetical protein [Paracoccaceae bacterium]
MYEFLAPWGVLAPITCAVLIYLIVSEIRRKKMMSFIEEPEDSYSPNGTVSSARVWKSWTFSIK